MPKKPKVVPIATSQTQPSEERPRLIAHEEASRRFILGIGSQRIAFDCSVRATKRAGSFDVLTVISFHECL
jgi:hypothetical protein